jgi:drug/metabolite transporter (DMT)-like permease
LLISKQTAYLLLLVSATCFAILPSLGKIAYTYGASPIDVVTLREVMTVGIMWAVIAFGRRDTVRFTRRQLGRTLGMAVSGTVMGELTMFYAIRYIDVSLALTISFTSPVLVSIISVPLFGERLSVAKVAALVIAFVGCGLTLQVYQLESWSVDLVGVGLSALTALSWTVFMLFARRSAEENAPVALSTWMATMAALLLVLIQLVSRFVEVASPLAMTVSPTTPWQVYAICAVIAVTSTGLPSIAFIAAVRRLGASRAAIANMMELPLTVLFAAVLLSERLDPLQIFGVIAVLAGVGVTYWHKEAPQAVAAPT